MGPWVRSSSNHIIALAYHPKRIYLNLNTPQYRGVKEIEKNTTATYIHQFFVPPFAVASFSFSFHLNPFSFILLFGWLYAKCTVCAAYRVTLAHSLSFILLRVCVSCAQRT